MVRALGLSITRCPSPQKMSPKIKSSKSGNSRPGDWFKKIIGMRVYPDGIHVAEDQSFDWRIRYDEEQLEKFEVEGRVRWKRYRDPTDPQSVQMTKPIFARAVGGGAFEVLADKHIKPSDPLLVEDKLRYNLIEKSSWSYIRPSEESNISSDRSSVHVRLDKFFDGPMFSQKPPRNWCADPEFPSLRIPAPSDIESEFERECEYDFEVTPPQSPSPSDGSELRFSFQSDSSRDSEVEAASADEQYRDLSTDESSSINIAKAQTILANIEKTREEAHAVYQERLRERQAFAARFPSVHLVIEPQASTITEPKLPDTVYAPEPVLAAEQDPKDDSMQTVRDKHIQELGELVTGTKDSKPVEKSTVVKKGRNFVPKINKIERRHTLVLLTGPPTLNLYRTCGYIYGKTVDPTVRYRRYTVPYHAGDGPERDPSKPNYRYRPCLHHGYNNKHKNVAYHTDYQLPDVVFVRHRRASVPVNVIKITDVVVADVTNALKTFIEPKPKARLDLISKLRIATAKRIESNKVKNGESTQDNAASVIVAFEKQVEPVSVDHVEAKPLESDVVSLSGQVTIKDDVVNKSSVAEDSDAPVHDAQRDSANSSEAEQEFLDDSDDEHEYFDDLSTAAAPFLGLTKVEDELAAEAKAKLSLLGAQKAEYSPDSIKATVSEPAAAQIDDNASSPIIDTPSSTPSTNSFTGYSSAEDDLTYNPWATPEDHARAAAKVKHSAATFVGSKAIDASSETVQSTAAVDTVQTQVTSAVSPPSDATETSLVYESLFNPSSSSPVSSLDGSNKIFPTSAKTETDNPIDADYIDLSHLYADDHAHISTSSSSAPSSNGGASLVYIVDQEIKTLRPARKSTFSVCSWSEGPDSSQNALRKQFGWKDPNEVKPETQPIEIVTLGPVAAKAALEFSMRVNSLSAVDVMSWIGQFEASSSVEQIKRSYNKERQTYRGYMGRPDHLNNIITHKDIYPAPIFDFMNPEIEYMRGSDMQRITRDNEDLAESAQEMDRSPAEEALRRKAHRELALARLDGLAIGEYRYYFGFLTVEEYNLRSMCVCFGVCECYLMCSRYADIKCPCAEHIETKCE